MDRRLLAFLGGQKKAALGKLDLHLISAGDMLQARAEALVMAGGDEQAWGLCLNACILAKAARREGVLMFRDGRDVLETLPAEKIGAWMGRYLELCGQENPSCCGGDQEALKQALADSGYERLKWRVLRAFGVLPSEARARAMTDGDYLYCVLQMTLDEEEALGRLCPSCRTAAMSRTCPVCGAAVSEENPQFDEARFEELRSGGVHTGAAAGPDGSGGGIGGGDADGAGTADAAGL